MSQKRRTAIVLRLRCDASPITCSATSSSVLPYYITTPRISGNSALSLPLWFIEGMAEYLSVGPVDPNTSMWMREAARQEKVPDIKRLDDPRYFPYRYGHALWAFIGGTYGDRVVGDLLRAGIGRTDTRSVTEILGVDSKRSAESGVSGRRAYRQMTKRRRCRRVSRPSSPAAQRRKNERRPEIARMVRDSCSFPKAILAIDLSCQMQTGKIIRRSRQPTPHSKA